MKRYGGIFPKIYSMENLYLAHENARRDKTFYKEVKMVDSDPEYYLGQIQQMLKDGTYKVSEYAVSIINDKGKDRKLMKLPYFPDRIIQWAIMLQIEHIFMQVFCSHTCASVFGRGIKEASRLTGKYMKDRINSRYCLKVDISKFYPNINHRILKTLLMKKINDRKLLELLFQIIDSYPGEKGVPIGSYLSQYLANFYLAYFDHWLKEKMGVKAVVRYMDDIVIFHWSSRYLHWLFHQMEVYLDKELDLTIKPNHQVFPSNIRGVDFVGYRFFHDYKLLRKNTCKKFKKKMLHIKDKQDAGQLLNYSEWCSANSYVGWLIWCDSWRLYEKYVEPVIPSMLRYYREVVCQKRVTEEAKNISLERYKNKLLMKKGRLVA